ncbi:MAG: DUF1800 domain-containing protein [Bacteroidetes bacterium]|nr:DUF1800 domain-containing protein [Bacteroidota bacterium]
MQRRDFLKNFTTLAPSPTARAQATPTTGLTKYSGSWGNAQVLHLLRRTLFGVKESEISTFKALGLDGAVNKLLAIDTTPPSPPVNYYSNGSTIIDLAVPAGQTWVNAPFNNDLSYYRRRSVKMWWTGMLLNDTTIREKMVLFWQNHFSTEGEVIYYEQMVYKMNALLRKHCLGNFKTMIKEVTIDPGMLRYLNGYLNTKTAPDENYGRELQELFTVGKGKDSHYTEDDVKNAAKVLTGWRIDASTVTSYFDGNKHETSNKQFSSFYNNTVITGKTGASGAQETDELITMIFQQNEVAKFICRKLYRWFVYYDIDSTVETNVIEPLATIFRNNNYDIKPVIETLLKSEHFFDTLSMGCQIKSPIDFVLAYCRQTEITMPASSEYVQNYNIWGNIQYYAALGQQDINDPPNVSGWPAYYQEPQFYEFWINSDTLPKRLTFAYALLYVGTTISGFKVIIDVLAFADKIPNASDPNKLVDGLAELLLAVNISSSVKAIIKSALLSGQSSDYYWTDAWNAYKANPNDTTNKTYCTNVLRAALKYIFELPEYQLN